MTHKTTKTTKSTKKSTRQITRSGTAFVCLLVTFVVFVVQVRDPRAQSAISDIVSRIGDPDPRVRLQAIDEALRLYLAEDLDAPSRKALVPEPAGLTRAQRAFAGVPFAVWGASPPQELTAALLRAVADGDRQVRLDAAYTFGAIARAPLGAADVEALLRALGHADAPTRAAAARVLGRLEARPAGDALVTAMNDPDDDVRVGAMWALGELRFERAVESLTRFAAYYGRAPLGLTALEALARVGHPSSAALFRAALTDRSALVRRIAAEGLGRSGETSAIQALEAMLASERDPQVRAAALFALEKLGRQGAGALASLLADRRAFARARGYLLELDPSAAAAALERPDADVRVRLGAADVLGIVGTESARAPLAMLSQDADPEVREAARRALERLTLRGGAAARPSP
jgi:HEAT repeat protein